MISARIKRAFFVLVFLLIVALGALGYYGYMFTRDIPFDWENPNFVEANEAKRKLKLYDTSLNASSRGFVRLSQLEINSYLMTLYSNKLTNVAVEGEAYRFKRAGVSLNNTNFFIYSWGETSVFGKAVPFVVMRGFQIKQEDEGSWEFVPYFLQVGNIEIRKDQWFRFDRAIQALDAPLRNEFSWTTNIQAMIVRKNELSQRPELRLYTYKPIPPADLR